MKRIIFVLVFLFLFPSFALANIGVVVGTGKIVVDDKLVPGMIYKLPSLTVMNTGDEPSDYEAGISYLETQKELRPSREWFSYNPQKFYLEPGQAKSVEVTLSLPLKTEPGPYFAFLEGFPSKKADSGGGASIGVAAAAKLSFTVVPANIITAIFYKITSFFKVYSPWPQRVIIVIVALIVLNFLRKNFNIEINKKTSKSKEDKENNNE